MHKIHASELTINDFSSEKSAKVTMPDGSSAVEMLKFNVAGCECLRKLYNETKDRAYWDALIEMIPSSFNQMRTIDLSYETLLNMYFFRHDHKLTDWHRFCDWILTLPYMKEFIRASVSMSLQLYANRTGFWVVNRPGGDIRVYADDPSKGGHFLPIPECIKPLLNYKETTETKIYRPHVIQI